MGRLLLCVTDGRGALVAASGGELILREWDPGKHLAGIFPAAGGIAALLGGQTVVQHRNQQLGIPLQTDDGELTQGHQQLPVDFPCDQFLIKQAPDTLRDLGNRPVAAALADLGAEDHGIQYLHHLHQFAGQKLGDCLFFELFQYHTDASIFVDANSVEDTAHVHIGNRF